MDRAIYTAMTGARQAFDRQSTVANNLANVSTTGFREQLNAARAVPVQGDGIFKTRTAVVESTPGASFAPGPILQTGRQLDVAMKDSAWLAVQAPDGGEAYTRRGDLQVSSDGFLVTGTGQPVIGDGGPVSLPPGSEVFISEDGVISAIGEGESAKALARVSQLKLIDGAEVNLVRGDDGLFRAENGAPVEAGEGLRLVSGALEGSNVNAVEAMVAMIGAARHYEMQMSVIDNTNKNEQKANSLLSMRG